MTQDLINAAVGGGLIGLAAVLLMLANGRIAGISGIVGGLFTLGQTDRTWRLAFVTGLIAAPLIISLFKSDGLTVVFPIQGFMLMLGGFLVGFGTQLGGGCTSGHGVCGVSRLSQRSIVATVTFMVTGIVTVYFTRGFWG